MIKVNIDKSLIGQRYGYLIITDIIEGTIDHHTSVICKCSACGSENNIVKFSHIKIGHKKSCGCMAKYKTIDIIGKTFGFLKILKQEKRVVPGKKSKYIVICQCNNCGNDNFKTLKASVMSGRTTSCGCRKDQYIKNSGPNSPQWTGYGQISGRMWSHIIHHAERRGLDFNITIEYAWDLFLKQDKKCALSNIDIHFGFSNVDNTTASIDRIDNEKGYIKGNVQWVHKDINIMRNIFSVKYYIHICKLIAKHNQ